ncbi:MAG: toll/interleukin-1 receptor domain-containing protein, partial [archaeon]|nr:toll/interleukin-1 receptor domain-containing protein [archaeon]
YLAQTRECHPELVRAGIPLRLLEILQDFDKQPASDLESLLVEKCTLAISFLVGSEEQAAGLIGKVAAVPLLFSRLKDALQGDESYSSLHELLHAIRILSANDKLKSAIASYPDAVPRLIAVLALAPTSRPDPLVTQHAQLEALRCLAHLSFDPSIPQQLVAHHQLVPALEALLVHGSDPIREAIERLQVHLGIADLQHPSPGSPSSAYSSPASSSSSLSPPQLASSSSTSATTGSQESEPPLHVMISYSWAYQQQIRALKKRLDAEGLNVWIDCECLSGSVVEAMADAIDRASVVLFTVGKAYKESDNCRLEAEYCIQRKKKTIPIMMEPYWTPSGWLGLMLGTKLWFDCSTAAAAATSYSGLLSEIRRHLLPSQPAMLTASISDFLSSSQLQRPPSAPLKSQSSPLPSHRAAWTNACRSTRKQHQDHDQRQQDLQKQQQQTRDPKSQSFITASCSTMSLGSDSCSSIDTIHSDLRPGSPFDVINEFPPSVRQSLIKQKMDKEGLQELWNIYLTFPQTVLHVLKDELDLKCLGDRLAFLKILRGLANAESW